MHCSRALRQLQLYIDRQLTLKQLRELELHLSSCSRCRQELLQLERISRVLNQIDLVREPADLTSNIMRRVAQQARQSERLRRERAQTTFRPSVREILSAGVLATVAMFAIILGEPALRAILPFANGHDVVSLIFADLWSLLRTVSNGTLLTACWIVGTILGVWITLVLAGSEMRAQWFRAVINRLPSW